MSKFFLKSNIKAEPTIWNWYAWSHLISPTTAGYNLLNRYIKIMESFIKSPHTHVDALKNPELLGGPFIDLDPTHINNVKNLLGQTYRDCLNLLQLASSFNRLNKILQGEAQGSSLESLYQMIPDNIKGTVELCYDLNHRPSVRLIEPLIYARFYNDNRQSIVLSVMESDHRPFVLSTPKFKREGEIQLNIPFKDERLNELFKSRFKPYNIDAITSMFKLTNDDIPIFKALFTENMPTFKIDNNFTEQYVRIRYFGHACILLQYKNCSILIDPIISYEIDGKNNRYTYQDLPDIIDYVLITHNHQDHFEIETLLQLRHKIKHVIYPDNLQGSLQDPSMKLILNNLGFDSTISIREFEEIEIEGGSICGIPFLGEHADLNIQSKIAYWITLNNKKFIFAADSNNLDNNLYNNIFELTGSIDALFLGMECEGAPLSWLYGPLLDDPLSSEKDKSRRLSGSNCEKALKIVESLKCQNVFVYAMGQEAWLGHIMALLYTENSPQIVQSNQFIEACKDRGIKSERLYNQKELIF